MNIIRLTLICSFLAAALTLPAKVSAHPDKSHCAPHIDYGPGGPPHPPPTIHFCEKLARFNPGISGAQCHIRHAATPAQICSIAGGMQYWFIGADGSAQPGPVLPDAPNQIERYEGVNSLTGKPVTIEYVIEGDKKLIKVSTFYPDSEFDTNKPYIFTLDPGHAVNHIIW